MPPEVQMACVQIMGEKIGKGFADHPKRRGKGNEIIKHIKLVQYRNHMMNRLHELDIANTSTSIEDSVDVCMEILRLPCGGLSGLEEKSPYLTLKTTAESRYMDDNFIAGDRPTPDECICKGMTSIPEMMETMSDTEDDLVMDSSDETDSDEDGPQIKPLLTSPKYIIPSRPISRKTFMRLTTAYNTLMTNAEYSSKAPYV